MPTFVKIDTLRGSGEIIVHNFNSSEVLVHRTIITQDNALKLINELIAAIDVAKDIELLKYENELKLAKERKVNMEFELSNMSKTIEDLEAGSKKALENLKNFKSQVVNVPTDFAKKEA